MTITRVWQACAEFQDPLLEFTSLDSEVNNIVSSDQARTGTYSFRTVQHFGFIKVFDETYTQFRLGFHLYHTGTSIGDTPGLIAFGNALDADVIEIHYTGDTGTLSLRLAETEIASVASGTFSQTSTWFHVGIDCKIGASGWFYMYVDGLAVFSYEGDLSTAGNIQQLEFNNRNGSTDFWGNVYIDDIFFDNASGEALAAPVPDRRFYLQKAAGNGSNSDLSGNDGNSTDNYALVDDIPIDSGTTYVEATASGARDTYTIDTFALPEDFGIKAVIPYVIALKSDAGVASQVKLIAENGDGDNVSAALDLATSYGLVSDRQETQPNGSAWTEAAVNAAEIGAESAGSF